MNIDNRVIKVIRSVIEESVSLSANSQLCDLNVNSIDIINSVVSIEAEFEFEFEDRKLLLSEFHTIQSIIDYIKERTGGVT